MTPTDPERRRRLRAALEVLLERVETLTGPQSDETGVVLSRLGPTLRGLGKLDEARAMHVQGLDASASWSG